MGRIHWIAGIVSSAGFLALWIAAALLDPEWHLGQLSLSDLGHCGIPSAELCFNLACGLSGASGIILCLGLIGLRDSFRFCGYTAFIGCFALIGVGIANLGYHSAHMAFAGTYFILAITAIVISIFCDHKEGRDRFAVFDGMLFILIALSTLIFRFVEFEPMIVGCILLWTFVHSVRLLIGSGGRSTGPTYA